MPYIEPNHRTKLNILTDELAKEIVDLSKNDQTAFAGLLNYSVTRLATKILLLNFGKLRYWHSPIIRGVLADVADEFYRRVVAPYENKKINENGDVDLYKIIINDIDPKNDNA